MFGELDVRVSFWIRVRLPRGTARILFPAPLRFASDVQPVRRSLRPSSTASKNSFCVLIRGKFRASLVSTWCFLYLCSGSSLVLSRPAVPFLVEDWCMQLFPLPAPSTSRCCAATRTLTLECAAARAIFTWRPCRCVVEPPRHAAPSLPASRPSLQDLEYEERSSRSRNDGGLDGTPEVEGMDPSNETSGSFQSKSGSEPGLDPETAERGSSSASAKTWFFHDGSCLSDFTSFGQAPKEMAAGALIHGRMDVSFRDSTSDKIQVTSVRSVQKDTRVQIWKDPHSASVEPTLQNLQWEVLNRYAQRLQLLANRAGVCHHHNGLITHMQMTTSCLENIR